MYNFDCAVTVKVRIQGQVVKESDAPKAAANDIEAALEEVLFELKNYYPEVEIDINDVYVYEVKTETDAS